MPGSPGQRRGLRRPTRLPAASQSGSYPVPRPRSRPRPLRQARRTRRRRGQRTCAAARRSARPPCGVPAGRPRAASSAHRPPSGAVRCSAGSPGRGRAGSALRQAASAGASPRMRDVRRPILPALDLLRPLGRRDGAATPGPRPAAGPVALHDNRRGRPRGQHARLRRLPAPGYLQHEATCRPAGARRRAIRPDLRSTASGRVRASAAASRAGSRPALRHRHDRGDQRAPRRCSPGPAGCEPSGPTCARSGRDGDLRRHGGTSRRRRWCSRHAETGGLDAYSPSWPAEGRP